MQTYDMDVGMRRENLEASSCHLEDAVRAKFDEVEHLIRQIGNISEIQPCLDLQRDQLQLQISFGIPRREIARRFGVSLKTLHRRIALWGLRRDDLNNSISDEELDVIVSDIHRHYPSAGYKMILGHLRSRQLFVKKSMEQPLLKNRQKPIPSAAVVEQSKRGEQDKLLSGT
ncbi:unnamed protein product [Arctogadus glacialis]